MGSTKVEDIKIIIASHKKYKTADEKMYMPVQKERKKLKDIFKIIQEKTFL